MPRIRLLMLVLVFTGTGRAVGQTTYDACYVPAVGAIYLIKQAGLPTACLAQSHLAFSWRQGSGVGTNSTAFGVGTTASGDASTALGSGGTASGLVTTVTGYLTTASGPYSTATGSSTTASGHAGTSMGVGTTAQSVASLAIGLYNLVAGSPTVINPTDPLFVAGNGADAGTRSNALTLLKNGNMTISGTLTQSSDIRFKEGVRTMDRALDGVLELRPIYYRFRAGTGHPTDEQIGLAAQEVERVFPQLVHRDAEGKLSLAYTQLAAILVRATQEQQGIIESLRAELAALRATVELSAMKK
jgi:endosialidase-like protein/trimeric autotransporter adhesin